MRGWREQFEARPLVVIAAGLVLGMVASYRPTYILVFTVLMLLASRPRTWMLALGSGLAGWLLGPGAPVAALQDRQFVQGRVEVVSAARPDPRGERLIVESRGHRLLMTLDNAPCADLGDTLKVSGVLRPLSEVSEATWTAQGVSGRLEAHQVHVLFRGPAWVRFGNERRRSFVSFATAHMPEKAAVIAKAICFNHDVDLDADMREALRRSGTIHVVSTSGLHVMLLAVLLMKCLGWLPVPRSAQLALLAALLAVYVAAAGLRAPAVRAAVLAMLFYVAYLLGREEDSISALAGAGAGYLLWEPHGLFDPGFQLSFAIFGALLLFAERAQAVRGQISVRAALQVGVVAWCAATPLVAYHFGWISWAGLLSNLAIAPIVPLAVATPLVAWMLAPVAPWLGAWLMGSVATPLAYGVLWVATIGGASEWSATPTPPFSGYWLPVIYVLGLLLWRWRARSAD